MFRRQSLAAALRVCPGYPGRLGWRRILGRLRDKVKQLITKTLGQAELTIHDACEGDRPNQVTHQ